MDYYDHMLTAFDCALESPDPSTQNGAVVLSRDGIEMGNGCNMFTRGTTMDLAEVERSVKYMFVEHAERNAIYDAVFWNMASESGLMDTLVCPWAACAECARAIVQTGIRRLVRLSPGTDSLVNTDRWAASIIAGNQIMENAGVEVIELDPADFTGRVDPIRRNGEMWIPQ